MKLRIPSKHRRNQDQHQVSLMQYAEHECAPIPVPPCAYLFSKYKQQVLAASSA